MSRHRLAAAGLALATATGASWLWSSPSQGDTLTASVARVGWWSQQPGAQAQPQGGFQITEAAQSSQSEAAVEVSIGDAQSVASATLKLTESAAVNGDNAALDVCTTIGGWADANPGAWTSKPSADCSSAVHLKRDAASTSWSGDVSKLVQPGQVTDLMVVPVSQPVGGLVDPGFQITVAKAEISADGTTSPASSGFSTTPGGSSFNAPADATAGSPSSSGGGPSASFTPAGPTFDAGPAVAAPPNAPAASAAPSAAPAGAPAAAPAAPASPGNALAASGVGKRSRPWDRLILFIPLAALAGFGATMARKRFPALAG